MPRPCIMRRLCRCLLWVSAVAFAQSPEAGRVEHNGSQATLIVDSARPLDSAAITIAEQFGVPVNSEDPPYAYKDDVKDVTVDAWRRLHPSKLALIPKGGRLEVQFASRPDGSPEDMHGLLQRLVDRANEQFPFRYRLDVAGDSFSLVPTHTRDLLGHDVEITPLLDRRITIPLGNRTVAETVNLMTAQLSAQTGLQVSCCQGVVAGIPWGMTRTDFQAQNEPARSVLRRLIASELRGRPNVYYWLQRCDPLPSQWCFINLMHLNRSTGTRAAQGVGQPPPRMPASTNPANPDGTTRSGATPPSKK
jgi:hypothetical protein